MKLTIELDKVYAMDDESIGAAIRDAVVSEITRAIKKEVNALLLARREEIIARISKMTTEQLTKLGG